MATGIVVCPSVCLFVTRGVWTATGIVVCQLFVCLLFSICLPGCHVTLWLQQVISFNIVVDRGGSRKKERGVQKKLGLRPLPVK